MPQRSNRSCESGEDLHVTRESGELFPHFAEDTRLLVSPDEVRWRVRHRSGGDGSTKLTGLVAGHCGSLADGEAAVKSLKAFGPPVMDAMGPIPYCALNGLFDPGLPPGALNYWKSQFLTDLSDDCIATLLEQFAAAPSPMSQIVIEHFHGAASRVPVTDTACAMRITGFNVVLVSQWTDPRDTDKNVKWCRDFYAALAPYLGTFRYLNYLDHDDGDDPAANAYGPNYSRLRDLKAKYDPENFFHTNVNIRPR